MVLYVWNTPEVLIIIHSWCGRPHIVQASVTKEFAAKPPAEAEMRCMMGDGDGKHQAMEIAVCMYIGLQPRFSTNTQKRSFIDPGARSSVDFVNMFMQVPKCKCECVCVRVFGGIPNTTLTQKAHENIFKTRRDRDFGSWPLFGGGDSRASSQLPSLCRCSRRHISHTQRSILNTKCDRALSNEPTKWGNFLCCVQ